MGTEAGATPGAAAAGAAPLKPFVATMAATSAARTTSPQPSRPSTGAVQQAGSRPGGGGLRALSLPPGPGRCPAAAAPKTSGLADSNAPPRLSLAGSRNEAFCNSRSGLPRGRPGTQCSAFTPSTGSSSSASAGRIAIGWNCARPEPPPARAADAGRRAGGSA